MHEKHFDPCPIHQYSPTHFCPLSQISQHLPEVCYFFSLKKKIRVFIIFLTVRFFLFLVYFAILPKHRQNHKNNTSETDMFPQICLFFLPWVCFFFNISFWKGLLFALFVLFDVSCRLNIDLVLNI